MPDLERQLHELAPLTAFPPTPPLATSVGRRLGAGSGAPAGASNDQPPTTAHRDRRRGRSRRAPRLRIALIALAALLLLAAGAAAAIPAARDGVLELLGLRAVTIERVSTLPTNLRAKPQWHLGQPAASLGAARRRLSFAPLLPSGLVGPDGVFLGLEGREAEVPGGVLTLTYPPQPGLPPSRLTGVGLLVNELHGKFWPGFIGKFVPPEGRIEKLRIEGDYAIWIEGVHEFFFHSGSYRKARPRLAANTLLVQRGKTMVRLEGEFGRARAIEIARSLTPAD